MVPLIDLDLLIDDDLIVAIAARLREVFARASGVTWNEQVQLSNLRFLMQAEKDVEFTTVITPRRFVYHYCLLLQAQEQEPREIDEVEARGIAENRPPETEMEL